MLTIENYTSEKYLAHGIRIYCCGYDHNHTSEWVDILNNKLYSVNHSPVPYTIMYHHDTPSTNYSWYSADEFLTELSIMEQSTHGIFCFSSPKTIAQTLLIMGYSILSILPLIGCVYINTTNLTSTDIEIIQNMALTFNFPIYSSLDVMIKRLLPSTETHIIQEVEVIV